jgi:FMN-dependent oxidoreductase (nitrilotriacetate monooxygenase family)
VPPTRTMTLGFIMQGPGSTWTDWRHPLAQPDSHYSLPYFRMQAETAERGKLHFLFVADSVYVTEKTAPYSLSRFEPLTVMSALAAVTDRIGLVATLTTTYTEPFNAARLFASLDHLSGGRAGWNVVTSFTDGSGSNFNDVGLPPHDERYRRAEEHLSVVQGLWDTWEDGTMVQDKETGRFIDPSKLHRLDHRGTYFNVRGPLNIARCPQGQPVIFQAGASDAGRDYAARFADCVFFSPHDQDEARAYYQDVKARAARFGRRPEQIKLISSSPVYIGETERAASDKARERAALIDVRAALDGLEKYFNQHSLSGYDLDGPFPQELLQRNDEGYRSIVDRVRGMVARGLTLREVAQGIASPKTFFIGTPEQVADRMQSWFGSELCDGFMISDGLPGELGIFVDRVVPILQERGLFHRDYEGPTLRDNLGLERPASRFARAADLSLTSAAE